MAWLLTAVAAIGLVELAMRLDFREPLVRLAATAGRAFHVMRAQQISDHWKERVLLAYSGRILASAMRLALLFAVFAAAALAAVAVLGWLVSLPLAPFVLSAEGLIFTSLVALGHFWIRTRHGAARI